MDILEIAIILFCILELSNVIILYFKPDFKFGNGVSVFNEWERSKEDKAMHEFVKYLVFWVAGTKLIFIVLLVVILFTGSEITKLVSVIALIFSILSYYWKLHPIIRGLDNRGNITPKGYSKTLGMMITSFVTVFFMAIVIYLIK